MLDVLSLADYDIPHRSFSLSLDPAQEHAVRLVFSYPAGLELAGGAEAVVPAGDTQYATTYSFADDEMLDAQLDVSAIDETTGDEIGWEYMNVERPLAITDFNYEPAYGRLRGWVNISGATTITLSLPQGVTVDGSTTTTLSESGFIEYPITIADGFETGVATASAEDEFGNTHQRSATLYGALQYAPDTLYAYPLQLTAAVGAPVTVVVATGQPAHALQFVSCVSVTIDAEGQYAGNSFNIGAPGGSRVDSDGIWAAMGVPDGQFLDLGDTMLPGTGTAIGDRHAYDFAVVSMGPFPAADAPGVLFNFQLSFNQPGTYRIGLREKSSDFDMTYYSDANGANYYWGALQADTEGNLNPDVLGYTNVIVVE